VLKRNETSGGSARALQVDAPHFLLRNMDRPGQNRRNHSDKYKHPSGTAGDRKTYLKMKRVNTPPDISPMMCSSDIVPSRRYSAMGYLGSGRFETVSKNVNYYYQSALQKHCTTNRLLLSAMCVHGTLSGSLGDVLKSKK
jgi:hypothetical protein